MTVDPGPALAAPGALSLDHVGLIVQDLPAAHAVMAALGFELTARADHTMTTPDGRTVSAGSSQHAIMLAHGYIELMQITDPQAGHQLAAAPQSRFGLHILALATPDAEASHSRFLASGQPVGPIRRWSRPVDEADRKGLARFVYFDAPWVPQDASYLCWVQHLTPELMRASTAPVHPNGALSVRAIHYGGPASDAQAWVARLQQLGMASRQDGGTSSLDLGQTQLHVQAQTGPAPLVPQVLEIGFMALDDMRRRCRALGLAAHETSSGDLQIDLRGPLGIELLCRVGA
jgi:catechol 2,3-dioxygenase-like lactoylglutathione lyase family enzyme